MARVLNCNGLGGLSLVLDSVHNSCSQRYYSHTVKFEKIETFLPILCITGEKKKYLCNVVWSKSFKFDP